MSSFYYGRGEPRLAVKCDICGAVLWTEREGQEFPAHITVDAKKAGWEHHKPKVRSEKWKDYCAECCAYMRQKKREAVFG